MVDPFEVASAAELAHALREEPDLERRIQAACATGDRLRASEIDYTPELQAALHDILQTERGWTDLRFETAIALCEAHDIAGEALTSALKIRHRRFDAVKALSSMNTPRVRETLRALAKRWLLPWPDRLTVAAALSVMGDEVSGAYFHQRLASRRQNDRRAMALHLLGDLRHPLAYSMLTAIAEARLTTPPAAPRFAGSATLGDKRAVAIIRAIPDPALAEDISYAFELLEPER